MSEIKLLTRAQYDALPPYEQGYATYMQAEHKGADLPKTNPYPANSREALQWERGSFQAMLAVQDEED